MCVCVCVCVCVCARTRALTHTHTHSSFYHLASHHHLQIPLLEVGRLFYLHHLLFYTSIPTKRHRPFHDRFEQLRRLNQSQSHAYRNFCNPTMLCNLPSPKDHNSLMLSFVRQLITCFEKPFSLVTFLSRLVLLFFICCCCCCY